MNRDAAVRDRAEDLQLLAAAAERARLKLADAVAARPDQFAKPRTATVGRVTFGFRRRAARAEPSDATLDLIETLLPPSQAAMLVRVKRSVNVSALRSLSDDELDLVAATPKRARRRCSSGGGGDGWAAGC